MERTVTNSGTLNERVQYYYDGWREIEERRSSAVQQYVYGMWIDEPLTLDKDDNNDGVVDQTYFYHQDGKTNVTALTNSSGAVVQSVAYDAYGRPSFGQNAVANPYLFAGRRYDPETGLYYFRARFYDPLRGRFLQRDPIGMWTDKANLGNGYTYVGNNPLTWTDPLGLKCSVSCKAGYYSCCWSSGRESCLCVKDGDSKACESGGLGSTSCSVELKAFPSPPEWQTCAYSPVFSVICSGGGLEAAPDGQVSPLTPIHFRGTIKELSPPSALPPPRPQVPGSSRCDGQAPPDGEVYLVVIAIIAILIGLLLPAVQ